MLASCASLGTTSPNVSIIDPEYGDSSEANFAEAQNILSDIASQNELLARELGKLPEVQDGVDQIELKALSVIWNVYKKNPKSFDAVFVEMYKVGKPEVRRYCSPLQAFFWLAQDERIGTGRSGFVGIMTTQRRIEFLKVKKRPDRPARWRAAGEVSYEQDIIPYSLERLLDAAWRAEPMLFTDEEIDQIIKEMPDKYDRDSYRRTRRLAGKWKFQRYMFDDYDKDRGMFSRKSRKLIGKRRNQSKWRNFDTVMERLNSPELLWYWIETNLTYKRGYVNTPYQVFKTKYAHCISSSHFGKVALNRAGYKTFIRHVAWGRWGYADHAGCGIILDDGRYYLVVDFQHPQSQPLSGPYDNISDVDEVLAYGHRITDRMWGTYFKPGN